MLFEVPGTLEEVSKRITESKISFETSFGSHNSKIDNFLKSNDSIVYCRLSVGSNEILEELVLKLSIILART